MSHLRHHWHEFVILGILAAFTFILTFRAPVSDANSDPKLSFLTSLALVEHSTFRLDAYLGQLSPPLESPLHEAMLFERNGHTYYAFPIGTPLLTTPVAWLATLLDRDLTSFAEHNRIQNGLAAISTSFILLLVYFFIRQFERMKTALLLTIMLVFGSPLTSSMGTAYWSHHITFILSLGCILLLCRHELGKRFPSLFGIIIGVALFFIYLTRPSMALFIILLLIYLWLRQRHLLLWAASSASLLFAGFLLWSQRELGSWFPPYYSPNRLDEMINPSKWDALWGQLISPSRGLFIFMPFLLIILIALLLTWHNQPRKPLLWLALVWLPLQLAVISQSVVWWGGYSFGPRLLLDGMPAMILITIFGWRGVQLLPAGPKRSLIQAAFVLTGCIAIWINAYQGLYNIHTARWNGALAPDINQVARARFDWRYPQFLATTANLCERNRDYLVEDKRVAIAFDTTPNVWLPVQGNEALLLVGWSQIAGLERSLTECEQASLIFYANSAVTRIGLRVEQYDITLESIALNDVALPLDEWVVEKGETAIFLDIPAGALNNPGHNELTFSTRGAGQPATTFPYRRGIALLAFRIDE